MSKDEPARLHQGLPELTCFWGTQKFVANPVAISAEPYKNRNQSLQQLTMSIPLRKQSVTLSRVSEDAYQLTTCENCAGEGGFPRWRGEDEEDWVKCPVCKGVGWAEGEPEQLTMEEVCDRC